MGRDGGAAEEGGGRGAFDEVGPVKGRVAGGEEDLFRGT